MSTRSPRARAAGAVADFLAQPLLGLAAGQAVAAAGGRRGQVRLTLRPADRHEATQTVAAVGIVWGSSEPDP